ncbi:Retrovirus-related Pol polyprotein from transposon opus [Vitis vinifera]|uniref:Retrovirus-related Pol polyprotein from transposon opus n=1 Tax=Vitis vinifera TaxID=29760 RepID=A0A438D6G7_VITVI|nr:Retrovirus-related Pol polyprotein from transposon opus [Vitis vinifera]
MRSSMNVGKGIWRPSMLVLIMALIHGSWCQEDGMSPTQEKGKFPSQNPNPKAGMYMLSEDMDMKAKVATMARRLEELELKKMHEVQAISETQAHVMPCTICQSCDHVVDECPTIPAVREMLGDQANVVGQFRPNNNAPYGNTYNSSWRNHPNFSWKPRPPPYQPQAQTQAPQQTSSVEQAIVNLSKVMGDFVGEQKAINSQLHQKIENVESSQIKRMDGMQNDLSQKIDNIQYSISRLTNLNTVNEKESFPLNQAKIQGQDEELMSKKTLVKESNNQEEKSGKKSASKSSIEEEPRIVIKEDMMKKHMPPPFPQALHGKKEIKNSSEILEVLRQVNQERVTVTKNAFLTEQVSAIIQSKSQLSIKIRDVPPFSQHWRDTCGESFTRLGASVNLLPYSVYKQLGLGGLKPTTMTLSLADRNGVMQLTFGNMTLELNIFHLCKRHLHPEEEEGFEEPSCLLGGDGKRSYHCSTRRLTRSCCGGPSKACFKATSCDLKYAYLEEDEKCPVVVSQLSLVIKRIVFWVLRKCKKAIGWQISDLKGISPLVCTHHIYMEEDAKPVRQPQRRQLVGEPTQVVPKKSGITVIQNEKGEEVSTRPTSGWRRLIWKIKKRQPSLALCCSPRCIEKDLVLNWEKCHFMVQKGIVLGHIISKNGIEDAKFVWDEKCQKSFEELKQFLTTAPIVRAPNWKLPFEVMCDSSDLAMGAVLGQREDGKPYVIYYASKTLNEAQRNYTTTEKELLAVVFALDKFRAYLVGSSIVVFTDHSALKYLLTKQDAKARLIRWILLLQEFNLQIRDKKGGSSMVFSHCKFLVTGEVPSEWSAQDKRHFFAKIHAYYWEEPFLFKYCADQIIRKCVPEQEQSEFFPIAMIVHVEVILPPRKQL